MAKLVEVELVVVEFVAVKSCKVVEARNVCSPPQKLLVVVPKANETALVERRSG